MLRRRVRPRFLVGADATDCLVILFHGCTWMSSARETQLRDVVDAVRESIPGSDIFMPLLPIEFWSLRDPDTIVSDVLEEIDRLWNARASRSREYRRVVLVGFSFGSVLLRQLFCRAAGAAADATVSSGAIRPWATRVERIVLLAGLNRGWTVDSPVTRIESMWNNIATAIGHLLPRKPTLFSIRRGAPFLTRTRLQWLALEQAPLKPPLSVQLLGTRDDIVSPVDNIDLATGSKFVYLEVPESGHFEVVHMSGTSAQETARRRCFQNALVGTAEQLRAEAISEADLLQLLPIGADPTGEASMRTADGSDLDDVVFVVHGIRDKGYWTHKIARVVVSEGKRQRRRITAIAPTYGYFPMLPFLLPWTRRAKVEWLLDLYVSVRCWHPRAAVSFIGHSNGTYILAAAVASCPAVRFKNVVFAGSVVRSNFEWQRYLRSGQVGRVLNYVATSDWVVAIFPRLFQVLRFQDLGGAGHDGFADEPSPVTDVEYVAGRHSAALDECHWRDMAAFVLGGEPPKAQVSGRSNWVRAAGHVAALVWLVLAVMAGVPLYLLLIALGFPEMTGFAWLQLWQDRVATNLPAWCWAGALVGWIRVLSVVLTRL